MPKLKLDPELLRVESFVPGGGAAVQGTVRGHSIATIDYNACGSENSGPNCAPTHPALDTCGNTCIAECLASGTAPCTQCV